jgi:hypothetical protein
MSRSGCPQGVVHPGRGGAFRCVAAGAVCRRSVGLLFFGENGLKSIGSSSFYIIFPTILGPVGRYTCPIFIMWKWMGRFHGFNPRLNMEPSLWMKRRDPESSSKFNWWFSMGKAMVWSSHIFRVLHMLKPAAKNHRFQDVLLIGESCWCVVFFWVVKRTWSHRVVQQWVKNLPQGHFLMGKIMMKHWFLGCPILTPIRYLNWGN